MRYLFPRANFELNKKFKNKKEICSICNGFGSVEIITVRAMNKYCKGTGIINEK